MSFRIQDSPNRAAFDTRSSQDLRSQFQKDPQQGLKAAAQQFETLFLQQVIKSMRDATPSDGMLNSEQSRFYTSLLDQQMAQNIATSGKGIGFAKLIEQQLGRNMASAEGKTDLAAPANAAGNALPLSVPDVRHMQYTPVPSSLPTSASYPAANAVNNSGSGNSAGDAPASSKAFVDRVWPAAVEASKSTGIPPQFLVGHAALESGWGKSEIRKADGSSSNNLFGIKAGKGWNGPTVEAKTTEYVDGQPQTVVARFRAYASYDEAFRDYASLLRGNPRYSSVIGSQDGAEFAKGLQRAGYATDPAYAEKLNRIISGPSLRMALVG
ncbi:MAG: flagellar assembly peptidoglycan hydrolase FlgJ [Rhodocyclales bacterium GT-UBC]|nr:MAG: flagellar assembly peptidoglycan hydrolase FlgJ [Rhodocyclales bacterium GT-UBC]